MDGSDATDFRDLPVCITFTGGGVNVGDTGAASDGSTVRDFFSGIGLGAMIGGGLSLLNCHLSSTEAFLALSVIDAEGLPAEDGDVASPCVFALTIL